MKEVIANLDNDWMITGDEVDTYLRDHRTALIATMAQ